MRKYVESTPTYQSSSWPHETHQTCTYTHTQVHIYASTYQRCMYIAFPHITYLDRTTLTFTQFLRARTFPRSRTAASATWRRYVAEATSRNSASSVLSTVALFLYAYTSSNPAIRFARRCSSTIVLNHFSVYHMVLTTPRKRSSKPMPFIRWSFGLNPSERREPTPNLTPTIPFRSRRMPT